MTTHIAADALRAYLAQYTGTVHYYRHPFNRTSTYTDGVKAFAERAGGGAYWLLDIVMTEPAILRTMKAEGFIVIELHVKDEKARLMAARDIPGPTCYDRAIDYTDCPEGVWRFYFCDRVLMLPSEY